MCFFSGISCRDPSASSSQALDQPLALSPLSSAQLAFSRCVPAIKLAFIQLGPKAKVKGSC